MAIVDIKTGKPLGENAQALNTVNKKCWSRRDIIKGGLAGIIAAGVSPSLCGSITHGMMYRGLGIRMAMISQQKEDNRWAQEVMWKVYPTTEFIEEHHNQKYTEELTKVYGGN